MERWKKKKKKFKKDKRYRSHRQVAMEQMIALQVAALRKVCYDDAVLDRLECWKSATEGFFQSGVDLSSGLGSAPELSQELGPSLKV